MNNELLQPTLIDDVDYNTSSYDIGKLFYVAFFGGILPTVILGFKNAHWLKADKKLLNIFLALGGLAILAKIAVFGMTINWDFTMDSFARLSRNRELRWGFRIVAVGIFLSYYLLFKNSFQQHLVTNGEIKPILKDAIIWSVVGGIIEAIILAGGVYILAGVI